MSAPFSVSLAVATMLLNGPRVAEAAAGDTADGSNKPMLCTYRDAKYGPSAVICVAPHYGQTCGTDGKWLDVTNAGKIGDACANAQISVPGTPPTQCIYRDIKYAVGSIICVAPSFGQQCGDNGSWTNPGNALGKPCETAQIPTWYPPPASSSSSK
jgi:hypothetical protein